MKTITEYTNDEVLELTDDELSKIIDYQCALAGIPLLPNQPDMPIKPEYDLDSEVYTVGGFMFRDKESAESVKDLINKQSLVKVDYDYNIGYDYKYVTTSDSGASVEVSKHMSISTYDKLKSEIAKSKAEFDVYNKLNTVYNDVFDQRSQISNDVWSVVSGARARYHDKLDANNRYEKYLGMAEGNKTLALKFFSDAYPGDVGLLDIEETALPAPDKENK